MHFDSKYKYKRGLLNKALFVGIHRHVQVLSTLARDNISKHPLERYERERVLQYLIENENRTHNFSNFGVDNNELELYRCRKGYEEWFSTSIPINSCNALPLTSSTSNSDTSDNSDIVQRGINLIDSNAMPKDWQIVTEAVMDLFQSVCKVLAETDGVGECAPLLVGSASEATRCFLPNEFDVMLWFKELTKPQYIKKTFFSSLKRVLEMQQRARPNLVLNELFLLGDGKFPCLHVNWMESKYRNIKITIDIIPTFTRNNDEKISLPFHHYMGVLHQSDDSLDRAEQVTTLHSHPESNQTDASLDSAEQASTPPSQPVRSQTDTTLDRTKQASTPPSQPMFNQTDASLDRLKQVSTMPLQHVTIQILQAGQSLAKDSANSDCSIQQEHQELNRNLTICRQYKTMSLNGITYPGTSPIENRIIQLLPPAIREGYKIAKAMRIVKILQPVIPQLIELGVAGDTQDIVKTYMLKTCVFFITQHDNPDHHDDSHDCVHWAIRIYEKLRDFLQNECILGFFADMKGKPEYLYCNESKTSKLSRFPRHKCSDHPSRYECCRQQESMLLITDRILHVLRLWRDRSRDTTTQQEIVHFEG